MAGETIIELGAFNVVASPHPEGVYVELLKRVTDVEAHVWGSDYAKITEPRELEDRPGYYFGRILLWTHIDKDNRWLDKTTNDEASEDDKDLIVIPNDLEPNFRSFHYGLIESKHRLVVEYRNDLGERFGPSRALRLFSQLFTPENLGPEFPEITVTPIPEDDSVEKILALPRLRWLEIHIERPNPDDLSDDAKRVLERLEGQGAKSQDVVLHKAAKMKSLTPNNDTKLLAKIAAFNGHVAGAGRDGDGKNIEQSTKQHPKIVTLILEQGQASLAKFFTALRLF
jgi:hypothetical protein